MERARRMSSSGFATGTRVRRRVRATARRTAVVTTAGAVVAALLTGLPSTAHATGAPPTLTRVAVVDQGCVLAVNGDGSSVAYTNLVGGHHQLYRYASGSSTLLTAAAGGAGGAGDGDTSAVALDKDGGEVAFVSDATDLDAAGAPLASGVPQAYLARVSADGTTLTRLPLPDGSTSGAGEIAISADGGLVAFGDNSTAVGRVQLWRPGSGLQSVDVTPSGASTVVVHRIALSADGSTLAAVVDTGAGTGALVLADLTGGSHVTMPGTVDLRSPPALTGDGATVVAAPAGQDYLLSWAWRAGGSPSQIDPEGYSTTAYPSISADGNVVGLARKYSDEDGFYVMADIGQDEHYLSVDDSNYPTATTGYGADATLAESRPQISADGLTVAFRSNAQLAGQSGSAPDGQTAIYLGRLDDSQPPTLDPNAPLRVGALQNSSVTISLPGATDDLAVIGETLTDNGTPVSGTLKPGGSYTADGLVPGSKHVFTATAYDQSRHQTDPQSLTVWMPQQPQQGSFDSTPLPPPPTATAGFAADDTPGLLSVDDAGRFVAFAGSVITGVDPDTGPQYGPDEIYLADTHTRSTILVSHTAADPATPAAGVQPAAMALSADGRYLAYVASATDLVAAGSGAGPHLFVYDRTTGASTLVPTQYPITSTDGGPGPMPAAMAAGREGPPAIQISADGTRLLVLTDDPNAYQGARAEIIDWQLPLDRVLAPEGFGFVGAALSADGTKVALAMAGEVAETYVYDVGTPDPVAVLAGIADPLHLDADGGTLLLTSLDDNGNALDESLRTADLPAPYSDSNTAPSPTFTGGWPTVAVGADNAHVVATDGQDLYLTALPSGVPQRIAAGYAPALSAGGSAVAYLAENPDVAGVPAVFVARAHDTSAPSWPAAAALTATDVTTTSLQLSWPAAADDSGVTAYAVQRDGATIATLDGAATGYGATGLAPGTSYTFTVVAQDAAGNASTPLTTTASTLEANVAPGTDPLIATPGAGGIVALSWDPAPGTISGYRVLRDDGTGPAAIADVPAGSTSYDDTGRLAQTSYTYRVDVLDASGAAAPWTATATVQTPAITVSKAAAVVPLLADTSLAVLGGTVQLRVTGEEHRSASARIVYTEAGTGAVNTATTDLTPDPDFAGAYTGSWAIPEGAAALDSITGVLSDGIAAHDATVAAPGLPVDVSGAIAVTVDQPAAGSLAGSSLLIDGPDLYTRIDLDGPGVYTLPVRPGTGYDVELDTPQESDVAHGQTDVTAGITSQVDLMPVLHATLAVTVSRPQLWAGECTSDAQITVVDDAGTTLADRTTSCNQSGPVSFDKLPVGEHVTVTSTLLDDDPVFKSESADLTLVQGANPITLTHAALPTATLTGSVVLDNGAGVTNPAVSAVVHVSEHVDGRDWSYSASVRYDGTYSMSVLAGTADVTVSYRYGRGYQLTAGDATLELAAGSTTTHDGVLSHATLTVHVDPAAGATAGGLTVRVSPNSGSVEYATIPEGATEVTVPDLWWGATVGVDVHVSDSQKPVVLDYQRTATLTGLHTTLTLSEVSPTARLAGLALTAGTVGSTSNGMPILHWQRAATVVAGGCPGGGVATASVVGQSTNGTGDFGDWIYNTYLMSEQVPGSGAFSGTLAPQYPMHGQVDITHSVTCMPHEVMSPTAGPAGSTVYLMSTDLGTVTGVRFGDAAASYTLYDGDAIEAIAPPGSGTVTVTVDTSTGPVSIGSYTYTAGTAAAGPTGSAQPAAGVQPESLQAELLSSGLSLSKILNFLYSKGPSFLSNLLNIKSVITGAIADLHPTCKDVESAIANAVSAAVGPLVDAAVEAALPFIEDLVISAFAVTGPLLFVVVALTPIAVSYIAGAIVGALINAAVEALFSQLHCQDYPKTDALIDPSGTVLDTHGNPVEGAVVTILRADTAAGPFTPVDASQPGIEPAVNPEITRDDGVFHWDVRAGYYELQASKPGCTSPEDPSQPNATTGPYPVPPPQVGLVITLACPDEPPPPTPVVSTLSVGSGPTAGGTTLTVTGSGFTPAATVSFGTTPASTTFLSPDALSVVAPAGSGTVDVVVHTAGGDSATSGADRFFYGDPPTVNGLSVGSGPTGGGTRVTVTGTGFTGATAVAFGGRFGADLDVLSDTALQITTPAQLPGPVPVVVFTPAGSSAGSAAASFRFLIPVTLSVTAAPAAPVYGQDVTLSVTTSPPRPGGSIRVSEAGTGLAAGTVGSDGTATIAVGGLHAGTHLLTVTYPGDAQSMPASAAVTVTVARAATTLTIDPVLPAGPIRTLHGLPEYLRALAGYLRHPSVTAHLLRTGDGAAVGGARIRLDTWKGEICTASTDVSGAVTCAVPRRMQALVLAGEVHGEFAGSADYLPADTGSDRPPWQGRHRPR